MSMAWSDQLTGELRRVLMASEDLTVDAEVGARVILDDSESRVPKESGRLAGTGKIDRDRAGANSVGIVYSSVYARWIHEHLGFKHPHGGEAKFLETAMLTKGQEAVNKAGEHFWGRL